ncbi:TIGR02285 family protein [Desulfovibrio sp. JC010]|uniref:TIGR02285 family protein n=1 Tax=Desulfovibrio sp. JC010 TaxID=2593641 RepID=UPI0013D6540B|nr:TIGR02285 family protein [Desulfovibrio sp. JC010]NDV28748.1 TIGR02285 family protein [Desulfovibrio sp. JC010]
MRLIFFIILSCILLHPLPGQCTQNEDEINWYHADFPPSNIICGKLKGTGHENHLECKLQKALPEYKHTNHTANYGRILKQMASTNSCCVTMMKTPDREKYIQFSEPVMLYLSNGVITLKSRVNLFKPYMDEQGFISINKLFQNSPMRMGISKGRRYGGAVDSIVDDNPDSDKLIVHYREDLLESLLKNIQAERSIDYAIGYPHELQWLILQGAVEDKFIFIPIREMPEYILSYVGCSKNRWGRKIISKINRIIDGHYEGEYKNKYQDYLPKHLIDLHERCVSKAFPANSK